MRIAHWRGDWGDFCFFFYTVFCVEQIPIDCKQFFPDINATIRGICGWKWHGVKLWDSLCWEHRKLQPAVIFGKETDFWRGKKRFIFKVGNILALIRTPTTTTTKNDLKNQKYLLDILRISWRVNSCPLIHERFAQSVFKAGLFELCSRVWPWSMYIEWLFWDTWYFFKKLIVQNESNMSISTV